MAVDPYNSTPLEGRVTGLERDVAHISSQIGQIGDEVRSCFTSIRTEIAELRQVSVQRTKTNWQTIAAWCTAALSVITVVGTLAIQPIRTDLETVSTDFRHHLVSGGHPETIAAVSSTHETVRHLDRFYTAAIEHQNELFCERLKRLEAELKCEIHSRLP